MLKYIITCYNYIIGIYTGNPSNNNNNNVLVQLEQRVSVMFN